VVALSAVSVEEATALPNQLRALKPFLPSDTTVLVGGRAADGHASELDELGVVRVNGLSGLRDLLTTMGSGSRQAS
jgi:hypothetical protein